MQGLFGWPALQYTYVHNKQRFININVWKHVTCNIETLKSQISQHSWNPLLIPVLCDATGDIWWFEKALVSSPTVVHKYTSFAVVR
jgi:hypothetical protein